MSTQSFDSSEAAPRSTAEHGRIADPRERFRVILRPMSAQESFTADMIHEQCYGVSKQAIQGVIRQLCRDGWLMEVATDPIQVHGGRERGAGPIRNKTRICWRGHREDFPLDAWIENQLSGTQITADVSIP